MRSRTLSSPFRTTRTRKSTRRPADWLVGQSDELAKRAKECGDGRLRVCQDEQPYPGRRQTARPENSRRREQTRRRGEGEDWTPPNIRLDRINASVDGRRDPATFWTPRRLDRDLDRIRRSPRRVDATAICPLKSTPSGATSARIPRSFGNSWRATKAEILAELARLQEQCARRLSAFQQTL